MRFLGIISFCFFSLNFFGQTPASDKRIIVTQELNVVSSDPSNPDNIIFSTAVSLPGQKFTTPQSANLVLIPESNPVQKPANSEIIIMSEATSLPAASLSTSQSGSLKLIPVKSPDK